MLAQAGTSEATQNRRPVGAGGGDRLCPPHYHFPPGFLDLSTVLHGKAWYDAKRGPQKGTKSFINSYSKFHLVPKQIQIYNL